MGDANQELKFFEKKLLGVRSGGGGGGGGRM